ncbi:hypothetical protein RD792_002297 [Penstemon davidsonii]|uniref:Berberine/berberine-like domain-containing protein n=1 Tax=Penstemon davidsonii TaxID=160366 RepID=A0ABR0DRJ4_9LAMI|nr:hypothetical protein RD792_002297 [Penstemon davidsonii]
MKSDYVKTSISKDGIERILQKTKDSANISMMFNPYGGKMSEILESEISFPRRAGNIYKIQYLLYWNEMGAVSDNINLDSMREFYSYMTPFVSKNPREAFLNYRDIDNGMNDYNDGKVYGVKYFKNNFDRLVKVKTEFDPVAELYVDLGGEPPHP